MGTLYLIRHGQARFGSEDYDRLSDLGHRQCAALGRWLQERGVAPEAVLRGTLRRHRESLEAIASELRGLPEPVVWPALDEYNSEAVLRAVMSEPLADANTAEGYRQHFRLLRQGLLKWMRAEIQPEGMPAWTDFLAGVAKALEHVRTTHQGEVLLVSSGGPIATAVAQVLGAPPEGLVELNMRLRNSALTEFEFTAKRHVLLSYNTLPHLDHPERREWITYA